ncbi:SDR family NAD(P)-dependent oxidoreductase [Streptomyces sp. WAC07061]|uniref:SDR family oxidoreductase n=1 Tax=Streptomyces sp. WAC07061 TaxID=2487410 RepID=UPI000F76956E|nr:SDR family oxidoreductase [Streptomyces sp. WAC07061]RSS62221.1 SDR family NAD(P)-dependent oxidoreductase [Streptomyces sp. WAC07061]
MGPHPRHTPRTVVVTGASAGIGRACALAFAARGDRLALIARGRAGLRAAGREARLAGAAKVITLEADVADPEAVETAAGRAEAELGPVDVWVNDAFTSVFAPFTEITPEEFRRVTEVTYLGYVYATRAALRRMLPRDRGTVVQVGSAIAYRGIPLQSAYSGAKHALQGWHEALRCELLASGTRVRTTMVQMPAVNTPQFDWVRSRLPMRAQPVPPVYQPEVAARAVLFAADHPRRREYWVGGSTAATLIANALAPGLLDRYLARTGLSAQQTGERRRSDSPDNLFVPLDAERDFGAHGRFDGKARARSAQQWAAHRLGALSSGLARAWRRREVCAPAAGERADRAAAHSPPPEEPGR